MCKDVCYGCMYVCVYVHVHPHVCVLCSINVPMGQPVFNQCPHGTAHLCWFIFGLGAQHLRGGYPLIWTILCLCLHFYRLEKEIKSLEADIAQEKQVAEGLITQMVQSL